MMEDAEGKTHVKAILSVILVIFIAGFVLGYYIWGYGTQKHSDYKDMLQQTITYITTLEEKNLELAKNVSTLENEVASLKKQQGAPADSQVAQLTNRVAALEKENADLKAAVSLNEALTQENQQLRLKVQALVEAMNGSRPSGSAGNAPVQAPPQQRAAPN